MSDLQLSRCDVLRIFEACQGDLTHELRASTASWLTVVVDPEDTFQTAWMSVEAHYRSRTFQAEAQVAAWIREIVRKTHLDQIRYECAQKRDCARITTRGSQYHQQTEKTPAGTATPSRIYSAKEQLKRIRKALRGLSPQQQGATNLHMQGQSGHRIAQTMGRSVQAVYSYAKKARNALRASIDDTEDRGD